MELPFTAKKHSSTHYKIASFLSGLFMLCALYSASLSAQTISAKRGIAGDMLDNADCVKADSLTWYYNWANTPVASVINSHQNYLEFCPMLWNGTWNPTALNNYLNAHPEVKYLLAFNEPNFADQANMTVAQAVSLWPQVVAIANAHNLKIVSPAMSYCPGNCLPGYTNEHGTKWLDDFFAACPTCRVDYIGLHIYDTWYHGFRGVMNLYKKYNRPIWVTEFDYSGGTTPLQHASLMVDAIDLMENDPDIMRYAWFMTRYSPGHSTNTFGAATGTLTDLGKIYHYMSSYDKNFYHKVNAIIEAEHYIDKSVIYCIWNGTDCAWPYSVLLEPTTDVTGRLDAYNFASPTPYSIDTLFYNVDIPTTQNYSIDFRVLSNAPTSIRVHSYPGNTVLGTLAAFNNGNTWLTRTLNNVPLTAGQQKIYFTASNGSTLKVNWLRINCSSNCGTLPVELLHFNAYASSNRSAQLEWTTASEKNNKEFIVEKSTDGVEFTAIGSVPAAPEGPGLKEYTFEDIDRTEASTYYRLKQVDTDGNFSYSPIQLVTSDQSNVHVTDQSLVSHLNTAQDIFYAISTPAGQVIEQGHYLAPAGMHKKKFSFSGKAEGIYLVHAVCNDISYSGKLLVIH